MEYREIVSVTGLGGLYQLLSTKSDGAIVRNLADQSTKFISARLHNVTPLESIEIYTTGNNVRLHEVLQQMKDSNASLPHPKTGTNEEIKAYFKTVFPSLDEDRVYVSDMKKMLKWFEILKANNLLQFEIYNTPATEDNEEKPVAEIVEETSKKTTAKKASKKETADKDSEEKPAKKTTAKKAAKATDDSASAAEKPAKKTAKKKAE